MEKFIREDEAYDIDPLLGGPNSEQATMLSVWFRPMADIAQSSRWQDSEKGFREMVESMQSLLLTGGVMTNMFRPKNRGRSDLSRDGWQIILVCNDRAGMQQAADFFRELPEVVDVATAADSGTTTFYGEPPRGDL